MRDSWFELPGPSSFIGRLIKELRRGCNIVLAIPSHFPEGLSRALSERIKAELDVRPDFIEGSAPDPLKALYSHATTVLEDGQIRTIRGLTELSRFKQRIFFIENLQNKSWDAWMRFLEEYAHESRALGDLERSSLVVLIDSKLLGALPRADVLLSVHSWHKVVERFDIELHAYLKVRYKSWSQLRKDLAVAICAEMSMWDLGVCDWLLRKPFETLLDPAPLMIEIGHQRGWNDLDVEDKDLLWREGVRQRFDGMSVVHPVFAAVHKNKDCIRHLLWKAELRILFPYIEMLRQKILKKYRRFIRLPHEGHDGRRVTNLLDMEITNIEYQWRQVVGIPPEIRRLITVMLEVRNNLAHLEPVKPYILSSGELETGVGLLI